MKVAFSTEGLNLEAILDSRFGRCARFLVLDSENGSFTLVENSQNLNATQGAGIQSAQNVIESGAQALVTGHCGPKAFKVLHAAGIPIYLAESEPIRELIHSFEQGTLSQLLEPDVEGHW
jgi:predicted Fe-Mo cluster-binding NifX family protein